MATPIIETHTFFHGANISHMGEAALMTCIGKCNADIKDLTAHNVESRFITTRVNEILAARKVLVDALDALGAPAEQAEQAVEG